MDNFYEIESESKYHITIKTVTNIEDVVDEFITEDEIREMFDVEEGGHIPIYGDTCTVIKEKVVKEYLNNLIQTATEQKKKSIIIDDELVEVFKKTSRSVSDFIQGLRRIGNRLFVSNTKKERTEPNKRNIQSLVDVGFRIISQSCNKVDIICRYADNDYNSVIVLIKKLVTFEDIEKYAEEYTHTYGNDYFKVQLPFFRKIWDETEKYCPKKDEPTVDISA